MLLWKIFFSPKKLEFPVDLGLRTQLWRSILVTQYSTTPPRVKCKHLSYSSIPLCCAVHMYCATLGCTQMGYSVCVCPLCVLKNDGVLEYYTGSIRVLQTVHVQFMKYSYSSRMEGKKDLHLGKTIWENFQKSSVLKEKQVKASTQSYSCSSNLIKLISLQETILSDASSELLQ